jgi:hypothetical protein
VSPRFGKPLAPIRRNTGPSKNMVASSTNMRKVIEGNYALLAPSNIFFCNQLKIILVQKLICPFTVWINIFANSPTTASNMQKFSQSEEQFFFSL